MLSRIAVQKAACCAHWEGSRSNAYVTLQHACEHLNLCRSYVEGEGEGESACVSVCEIREGKIEKGERNERKRKRG